MRKGLFLLATAALMFASCENDLKVDENQALKGNQKEIGFNL